MTATPSEPTEATRSKVQALDAWLEYGSELLNPILIKESRQSLKSRQFVITFGLLLLCVWGWTAISVASIQSSGVRADAGVNVFPGYLFILVVPLMVIVPFSAFRSLAGEREDGTYELVSITSLAAPHIIRGKLASAMLQVMVYFSVTAPCIAFTYMLRGIDLGTITVTLGYTMLFSFALTCTALLLAASVRSIHWQILMTVITLVSLSIAAFTWMAFLIDGPSLLRRGVDFRDPDTWEINGFLISMLIVLSLLFLTAAVAQLRFASDNRSTRLRIMLLVVQSVFLGWMVYLTQSHDEEELLFVMSITGTVFWAIAGAMMTGERPVLSPRVRRSLPESFLGRMAFTWFNPGSASGYVFAVVNAASVYLAMLFLYAQHSSSNWFYPRMMLGAGLGVLYMAAYLGLGNLLLNLLRRHAQFSPIVALMIQSLLAVSGIMAPMLMHLVIFWNQRLEYSALQVSNWFWTIGHVSFRRTSLTIDAFAILLAVGGAAGLMFVINLLLAARQVRALREETPERVLAEERAIKGIPDAPPQPEAPRNPFED